MKIKYILLLLLSFLFILSCTETRDPSKDIVYRFTPEVTLPPDTPSGRNQVLPIIIKSDVYKNGFIDHECVYEDDKKSYLLSPKGDTIKPGEKFSIPHIDEYIKFNFYSEDLGDHNLKFIFKNSMGFTVIKEQKLLVEKGTFKIILEPLSHQVTIDTPLEIKYSHEVYDQLKHSYKIKFEAENSISEEKPNATLNGHKAGEWFDVSEISGVLSYIPLSIGTHKVCITSKNEAGIEKTESFTVDSMETENPIIRAFSIEKLVISGTYFRDPNGSHTCVIDKISTLNWILDTHSGVDREWMFGLLSIEELNIKDHLFVMEKYSDQYHHYKGIIKNHQFLRPYIPKVNSPYDRWGRPVKYKLIVYNTYGGKSEITGEIKPELDLHYHETGRGWWSN